MEKLEVQEYINSLINNSRFKEAVDLIEQYKLTFGNDDEISSMEAIVNLFNNNIDEAFVNIREGLKYNIFSSDLYYTMGNIYEVNGEWDRAYLCYEQALYLCNNKNRETILCKVNEIRELNNINVNKVSIVILTYNNLDYTKVCVDSIRKYNDKNTYELIIVDNNSTDGTVEWIKEQTDIKCILNDVNEGFPRGCNQGIEIAEKENDIFLLNNDTVIMPNSIFNLRMGLYSSKDVGATGPVSNSVSYYQQVNIEAKEFGDYLKFALENNISNENEYEERLKLVGFAMLIKRSVLDKIGFLDEIFTPGNFEDDDISLRMIEQGYKLILCKDTYIHHFGSVSFSLDLDNYNNILNDNMEKFKVKWGFSSSYSMIIRYDIINKIDFEKLKNKDNIKILEVGCACGATLLKIKNLLPKAKLYGVELDQNTSRISNCIAKVKNSNIETEELGYDYEYFDLIILPDVLEHLVDPWTTLTNMKRYLKKNGQIIASIPNVMHISVVESLLSGSWTYQSAGILDKTHLRFFTLSGIQDLFKKVGFDNLDIEYTTVTLTDNQKIKVRRMAYENGVDESQYIAYQYIVSNCTQNNIIKSSQFVGVNKNYYIDNSADIRGIENMMFGNNVIVDKDCWINIVERRAGDEILIKIGDNSHIGRRTTISAANKIEIGKNVIFGPNVLISDHNHEYKNIDIPISNQGIDSSKNVLIIGDDSWIGTNSVIIGNVKIGKHSVVAANSVVLKDIPDYCMAAGNPAKVIKIFDSVKNEWIRVNKEKEIERLEKNHLDIKDLKSIQVEVSSICNLDCPQCFNKIKGHKSKIISNTLWKYKIRPILNGLTDIHLVGIGEPLLCKEFFSYVKECVDLGITVHTTSNMQLVDKGIAKNIIQSGIKFLSFSCDGSSEETYNKIRVKGELSKLIKNVKMINELKKEYNSDFPKLILNFGAINSNIEELPDILYLAKELKVESVIAYHDIIYVNEMENESLFYNQKKSDFFFKKAIKIADEIGVNLFYPGLFSNTINGSWRKGDRYCNYPFAHLWIYSDGRVGPCCMDFPNRIILGDLNDNSLEEIWNSNEMIKLRESMSREPYDVCKYCANHCKINLSEKKFLIKV